MLQAGIGVKKLEVPIGLNMAGYVGRVHGSEGIADSLQVRSIALEEDSTKVLLISCDLLLLHNDLSNKIQTKVSQRLALHPDQIMICCTHTHSGPDTMLEGAVDDALLEWLDQLAETITECAYTAYHHCEPCKLTFHSGDTDFQQNRVLKATWGGVNSENWEVKNWDERSESELAQFDIALKQASKDADAMVYRKVLTICIRDAVNPDRIKAFLVNCACHPVIYELNNYLYSADFPGAAMHELENRYPGTAAFFFNGCCGDINPIERGSKEVVEQIGKHLADSVCTSLQVSQPLEESLSLRPCKLSTAYAVDFDENEVNRRLCIYKSGYQKAIDKNLLMEREIYKVYISWAERMQALLKTHSLHPEINTRFNVIQIGSVHIVTLPFEPFTGIGNTIREKLGENTLIFGYTNGNYGYFIPKSMYPVAKYERFEEYKFAGRPGAIEEAAEDKLAEAIDQYIKSLER